MSGAGIQGLRWIVRMSEESSTRNQETTLGSALHSLAMDEWEMLCLAVSNARARHRGIHESRKCIRRLRAIMALGHDALGQSSAAVDTRLKRFAEGLSSVRDAHVVVETAAMVARGTQGGHHWIAVRRRLAEQRDRILDAAMQADPLFAKRLDELAGIGDALESFAWKVVDIGDARDALERSLRRLKKAEVRIRSKNATLEDRHRWRRRLRRLRMQWTALKSVHKRWNSFTAGDQARRLLDGLRKEAPRFDDITQAADALGAEQDLRLLASAIARLPQSAATEAARHDVELRLSSLAHGQP